MSSQAKSFSTFSYGEGRTGIGQAVEFTCPPEDIKRVREFLITHVRTISTPTTGRVSVSHGGYGRYTRYDATQHDYAGGGPGEDGSWGYIEVLEIKNPPDQRWGIVINECTSLRGSVFTEWETLDDAREVFKKYWGSHDTAEKFPKLKGFKRSVPCGLLTPWFYAIGDAQLIGDYTFPEGLQDDPVYSFGRQFVVFDSNGVPSVKTCMGTRLIQREKYHRIVCWNDGSMWDESGNHPWWSNKYENPRPIEEGELWVTEAVEQFRRLLAGKSTEFTINFTNGHKFVGRLSGNKSKSACAEGDYLLVVHIKGEDKTRQGWINNFKPTPEAPDIIQFVTQQFANKGKVVERIEIKESKTEKGGKKWAGVFYHPPQ